MLRARFSFHVRSAVPSPCRRHAGTTNEAERDEQTGAVLLVLPEDAGVGDGPAVDLDEDHVSVRIAVREVVEHVRNVRDRLVVLDAVDVVAGGHDVDYLREVRLTAEPAECKTGDRRRMAHEDPIFHHGLKSADRSGSAQGRRAEGLRRRASDLLHRAEAEQDKRSQPDGDQCENDDPAHVRSFLQASAVEPSPSRPTRAGT